jgi:hypothetical protein
MLGSLNHRQRSVRYQHSKWANCGRADALRKSLVCRICNDYKTSIVPRNGTRLASLRREVSPMHILSCSKITVLGLALSSMAFAQSPAPAPPTSPVVPPVPAAAPSPVPQQLSMVTESSRVRAFNAGPGGEVRSLYLQNGSVVNLAPGLGGQVGPTVRKGEKITVTGTRSEINGQSVVEAATVRMQDQTFSANVPAPGPQAQNAAPPPPGAPQAPPALAPRSRNKVAAPAPCGATRPTPPLPARPDGPPPPPLQGAAAPPPPPDGTAPPPPPPQN